MLRAASLALLLAMTGCGDDEPDYGSKDYKAGYDEGYQGGWYDVCDEIERELPRMMNALKSKDIC